MAMTFVMLFSMLLPLSLTTHADTPPPVTLVKWDGSGTGSGAAASFTTAGLSENLNKQITTTGAAITGFTSGGPGSIQVDSANNWTVQGYWKASFATNGYSNITISSKQYSSGTGPKNFKLQYSLDGSTWKDVAGGATTVGNATWAGGVLDKVQLPADANDQSLVHVKWLLVNDESARNGTGSYTNDKIAATGTSRIADVVVEGIPTASGPVSVTGVTLNTNAVNMTVGGAVYGLVATVQPANATNPAVTWKSSDTSVATVTYGSVTAVGAGTAIITAATVDGNYQASAAVNVSNTAVGVTGVALDKSSLALTVGSTGQLTASVQPSNAINKAVTWNSDNTNVATVDAGGKVTAIGAGTATITVKTSDGNFTSSAAVNVSTSTTIKPGDVVFSQLYVNGGNSGAFYDQKFVELYNTTNQDINLNGWSIGYTSAATMDATAMKPLSGIIKAHSYFLIGGGKGSTCVTQAQACSPLPVPVDVDLSGGGLNTSGSTGGAIVLSRSANAVHAADDSNIVDLIAYSNAATTAFKNPLYWGKPFISDTVGSGTILRKTNVGSDPRAAFVLGNGWFTKEDTSGNFVIFAPQSTSNPAEITVRNSKYMEAPDSAKIVFDGNTSVIGLSGSVPANSTVKAYTDNGGTVVSVGQATAAADGSFSMTIAGSGSQSVYLTHTTAYALKSLTVRESSYARVDSASYSKPSVMNIGALRVNDANGFPVQLSYPATIEGVVTATRPLGSGTASFTIQDSTGGIEVIGGTGPSAAVAVGNKVRVSGKLAFAAGMTQFAASAITDLGPSLVPDANSITIDKLNTYLTAEPLEGKLVSVKGKVTNLPSAGPDYNVTITDDAGNTSVVKILGTAGIDMSSTLAVGDTLTFTGIVGQSKISSPYTSGYYVMPRNGSDIKGDLQFDHVPLTKAYTGLDIPFKAMAKYADSVTLYYKNAGDANYTEVRMATADNLNYNAKIPKENVKAAKMLYYIAAQSSGQAAKSSGDANTPNSVDIVADTDGPAYANELPANLSGIETYHPVVSVDLNDQSGVDASSITISIDGKDFTSRAERSESRVKLTLTSNDDLAIGKHDVTVSAKDKLGNLSTYTWSFQIVSRFTGGNHYRGTTHNHTQISHDAQGDPEKALQAAQAHNYDYFAFSDHSHDIDSSQAGKDSVDHNGMPERTGGSDWQLTKSLAQKYTKDGSFVVFPAFEMTSTTWGHSNVFGTTNFIDRVQDGGKYQNLQNYYAWTLTYDNIAAQFNHPAMSANAFDNFIPYDKNVDKLFTMLEVGNGSGHYSYVNAENKFFSALDLGWHVAPTYGEDNHDATWGQTKKRTVIVSKDLTQDSLLDAMRKMHVYFSEDPNFQLDVLANGYYMGATVDSKTLSFNVTGSELSPSDPKYSSYTPATNANVAKVELVTNGGRVIDSYVPSGDAASFNWKPTVNVVGGQQWFVVRVTEKNGDRIYSSPIWSPADPLSVKVNDLTVVEGAAIAGIPVTLKAGIANLGTINLTNLTAHFYYDSVDAAHVIGDATIASLASNKNADASVVWANPVSGDHKIIVVLQAGDGNDLGDNKYEQAISVKAPLGIKVMIDATHNNENTTSDTGTYANNLTSFTLNLKQQGYTVAENKAALTDALLNDVNVLVITHPGSTYTAGEIAVLKNFVNRGGSLLLTEKSNYGGTQQNLNSLLSGVGSSMLVNNDGVFDETAGGNFWSNPLSSNFSVKLHLAPVSNRLTDFVSLLDFYSGASLAGNDGAGNKIPLADSSTVTILARGNESTFQDSPQVKADTVKYNVQTANGKNGPALTNVTGGSAIPLAASEQLGSGRIFLAGMNIFNDKQMTQNDGPTNNVPFALNVVNWLANREAKVTPISGVRQLPEGTRVVVQGKVTTTAFYDSAYVQDDTGGIVAFSEVPAGSLQLGDTIRVYGHVGTFENDKELIFDRFANSIVKISSGPPVEPKQMTTAESVSEAHQGQLVQVKGKIASIPNANTYVVNDGSGDVAVFVDGYIINKSGVPVPALQVGDTLLATGLSGKYSEGNRIRVRDTSELMNVTEIVPVTGVKLNTSAISMTVGGTEMLTATVEPANATNKAVTWKSSDPNVATVDASGKVTAVGAGTAAITATTVDGSYTAAAEVNVSIPATSIGVTGVKLNASAISMTAGGTEMLTATVEPANATNKAVTWKSSDPNVATVDASGKVTAVGAGTATITVTTVDGSYTAAAEVNVSIPVTSIGVTGVKLNTSAISMTAGVTEMLTATVEPANATNKAVTWKSSDPNVGTVDASGKVTAVGAGTATITVTTVDGGYQATSVIQVTRSGSDSGETPGGNPGSSTGGDTTGDTTGSTTSGGSTGSGSTGATTGSTTGSTAGAANDKSITIREEQLTGSGNGKTTVQVPANVTEVKLPSTTPDLIKQNSLEIKSDQVVINVPSDLMKQLRSKLPAEAQKDSTIVLTMNPLGKPESKELIEKGKAASAADIKASGDIYELKLSITAVNGQTVDLKTFDKPITIRLKVDARINPKLAGIYYISDNGSLEYIGGKYTDGYMVAEIGHFSKYAVLEMTKSFADLPEGHWAANVIQELAAKQIVSGTSATGFEPERSVTRAEFTTLLVRTLKLTEKGEAPFTDVKPNDWYAEAISIAVKAGIVQGRSEALFDANAQITREEMVSMLMRAYEKLKDKALVQTSTSFTDESQVSSWAAEFVKAAAALHLIQGRAADKFDPKGITTRAEAAQVIYNLLNL
ncbi:Ig-like domain-containing protein [Paenibacillus tyrfis]|uniref:Ig-like domain-containing protein n=1 Tax=Paenibacillus tyrfis TaxID=1501230 RepID=UPI0006893C76|nr:Ig-like domain-containing protein [Paenibacillus tyrfis]